jgi:excisionase family DNA binding protein
MSMEHGKAQVTPPITVRIKEAIRLTGLGRSTLYEHIKAGRLETVKRGRATLIPYTSLERLVGRGP